MMGSFAAVHESGSGAARQILAVQGNSAVRVIAEVVGAQLKRR